jgi:hypothetical protein
MKKKMIQSLPTLFIHTTSFYHYDVTLVEIIQSENFPKGSCSHKESQLQRNLSPPNALLGEMGNAVRKKNLIISFDLKRSF